MTEARCACCDLPMSQCGRAAAEQQRRERKALRQQALREPGVIEARFPGICPGCGDRWLEGAPIRKGPNGWQGVLCCLPLDL
jgi:hypothetical protein